MHPKIIQQILKELNTPKKVKRNEKTNNLKRSIARL